MILLDTHVLVWLTSGDERLGRRARKVIDASLASETLIVSAISFREVAILASRGRLDLGATPAVWRSEILDMGVLESAVDGEISILSVMLEDLHPDPADRIIAATAVLSSATLVTADERLLEWKHPLRRQDARA